MEAGWQDEVDSLEETLNSMGIGETRRQVRLK